MDQLTTLLNQFSLRAGVFYSGQICGIHQFEEDSLRGHLHLIRRGPAQVIGVQNEVIDIIEPSILFLPRPEKHRLIADDNAGADVVCGSVLFGAGGRNPVTDSLPSVVLVALAALPGVDALLALMFDEAFCGQCGSQAALDRLCEVLMIRLLRHCIELGLTQGGMDPALPVLVALISHSKIAPRFWSDRYTPQTTSSPCFSERRSMSMKGTAR